MIRETTMKYNPKTIESEIPRRNVLIQCWNCREFNQIELLYDRAMPLYEYWKGVCPNCGKNVYLRKFYWESYEEKL